VAAHSIASVQPCRTETTLVILGQYIRTNRTILLNLRSLQVFYIAWLARLGYTLFAFGITVASSSSFCMVMMIVVLDSLSLLLNIQGQTH